MITRGVLNVKKTETTACLLSELSEAKAEAEAEAKPALVRDSLK